MTLNTKETNLHNPDEESQHDQLPSVDEIRMTASQRSSTSKTFRCRIGRWGEVVLITLVAVLIVVVIGLSVSLSKTNEALSNAPPPTPAVPRAEVVTQFLVENKVSQLEQIMEVGSPQNWAVKWIAEQDAMQLPVPSELLGPDGTNFVSRYVVALLYYALNGSNWSYQLSFLSENDICDWNDIFVAEKGVDGRFFRVGIACNNGIVTTVQLPGLRLEGEIPSEIQFLTGLRIIALNSNKIGGTLPSAIRNMTSLDYLAMQSNKLEGTLPTWLGSFPELRVLGLGDNALEGTIPLELGELTNLVTLGLDNNKLSGDIVPLQTLVNLERIYLENNEFHVGLEDFFEAMNDLKELDLSENRFVGSIPDYLFRYSNLRILDLHDNDLDGTLPSAIPFNPVLKFLSVYDNLLTGPMPSQIAFLDNLTHLDLSSNRFEGDIPDEFAKLTNLKYLFLSENDELNPGPIPSWIGTNLTQLQDLSLRATHRQGELPTTLGRLKELMLLDLHDNDLSGQIPRQIGELGKLRFMLLSKNSLTGQIPADFELLTSLDMMLLNSNNLTGSAEGVCTRGIAPSVFGSDCTPENPELVCECCTFCCADDDDDCNSIEEMANLDPVWESSFEREFYDFGADMIYSTGGGEDRD